MPHEVFISYSAKDRPTAEAICTILEARGIGCWVSYRDILPGRHYPEVIIEALYQSSLLILVFSSSSNESDWVMREVERAASRQISILTFKVEDVRLSKAMEYFISVPHWLDASTPPPERHLKTLAEDVEKLLTLKRHPSAPPVDMPPPLPADSTPRLLNVPVRNPLFTGRESDLKQLRSELTAHRRVALSGLPGIGKTQTAIEYAHRHVSEYKRVLWVGAESQEILTTDLGQLACKLNLPEKSDQNQNVIVAAIKLWLESNRDWLLVLDNVEDRTLVREFVPFSDYGHVLYTTRVSAIRGLAHLHELDKMSPQDGACLMLRRAGLLPDGAVEMKPPEFPPAALVIAAKVDGLPLALDQAGAFIEQGSTLDEYLELYDTEGTTLRAQPDQNHIHAHESVTTTFSLAFRKIATANAAAADLLRLCAFLAPDAIPEEILFRGAPELGPALELAAPKAIARAKAIEEACSLSLLRRDPEAHTFSIHRLVQAVLKDVMTPAEQSLWAERAVRALNRSFQFPEFSNWSICDRFLPHAAVCAEHIKEWGMEFHEAGSLLHNTGVYLTQRAQYGESEPLLQWALSIFQKTLGDDHADIARCLNSLAAVYSTQGCYEGAEAAYSKALVMWEQTLGLECEDAMNSLLGLGILSARRGQYKKAEHLYLRSLDVGKTVLSPEHPKVARCLNGLAELYSLEGRFREAEMHFRHALAIRERVLRPEHPEIAWSQHGLASNYRSQGNYDEAETLYNRALKIWESALGAEHPNVARCLNELAELYCRQGRYDEAERYFRKSLTIREKVLGPENPDTTWSLSGLAELHARRGRYDEAERLFKRVLAIREKVLGVEHPHTARALNALALLLIECGNYPEGEPLLRQSLSIQEQALGEGHVETITSMNKLAQLLYSKGDYEGVVPVARRALALGENVLGRDHPVTTVARGHLETIKTNRGVA